MTKEGHQKLVEDLEYLKTTKRRELAKAVGEARSHGDLSENAEYDAAREAQGMNELHIRQLEDKLSQARILDDENIPKDEVLIGATVKLKDLDSGEEMEYTLVSEMESDYDQGKISVTSPVGSGLLNHKENDEVEIGIPAGKLRYKIIKISRMFAFFFLLSLLSFSAGYSQNYSQEETLKTVQGDVSEIDWVGSTMAVRYVDGENAYPQEIDFIVAQEVKIRRGSEEIGLADLEIGDRVSVEYSDASPPPYKAVSIVDSSLANEI